MAADKDKNVRFCLLLTLGHNLVLPGKPQWISIHCLTLRDAALIGTLANAMHEAREPFNRYLNQDEMKNN